MTDPVNDALALPEPPPRPSASNRKWEPGYELTSTHEGTITTSEIPDDTDPDWDTIFSYWGLNPESWAVVPGSLRVNAWEMAGPDGDLRVHRQYKAQIVRRRPGGIHTADPLLETLAKWKPPKRKPVTHEGGPAWVVAPADWQVGGRGGVEQFQKRFEAAMSDLVDEARTLRKAGVTELCLGFLADMAEGAFGHYESQLYEIDLDRRDQTRVVTACELVMLRELAPYFAKTTTVAVPGNHSRNANDYPTGTHDVGDMTSFEWTASLLRYSGEAEKWGITFIAPEKMEGANFARVEAGGTRLLWVHGHQKSGNADKMRQWWRDTSFTRWGDADASDHLLTGHRHHTRIEEVAQDRWFFVCPTLGGPSTWFSDSGGPTSRHGLLHYVTQDASVENIQIAGARS